jgi:hypothetical protein
MLIAIFCLVLTANPLFISPDADTSNTPEVRLPKGGEDWDFIGTFKLMDGKDKIVTVRLYAYDSDSVAEKRLKQHGVAMSFYPNFFSLHAMYRTASGEWKHSELYGVFRVRFRKVQRTTADSVLLELRPNCIITLDPKKDIDEQMKRAEKINEPFTEELTLVEGVPRIKK